MRWRAAAVAVATCVAAAPVTAAWADHQVQHIEPAGPAVDRFADDVPRLTDDEWGFPIGGFGGIERGAPLAHAPVILVHGNVVDHGDWYPVRDDFLAADWTMQELWALSYNGMGNGSGSTPERSNPERDEDHAGQDNLPRGTNNDLNVPDLAAFIRVVQDYTGAEQVHLVGHSLGVTVIRKTMLVHPEIAQDVVSVVAIAGANHGTSLCAPGSEGIHMSCDEIALGTAWLEELNGPGGELETYGDTRWLTIYDGTGSGDVAFVGPQYAQSPRLRGAENTEYANVDHNGLRLREDIVAFYREWIEAADAAAGGPSGASGTDATEDQVGSDAQAARAADDPASDRALAATGGGSVAIAALALAAGTSLRRHRPRRRSGARRGS